MTREEALVFIGDLMERAYGWHINNRLLGMGIEEFEGKCEGLIYLLKAQEPKPPIVKENSYGWKFYYCPSCGKEFYQNNKFSFCEKCGQAVKWE